MKLEDLLPPLLTDEELIKALEKYPTFNDVSNLSKSSRLIHSQDLYKVYVPNEMSVEVYNQVYLLLLQSCVRKQEGHLFHPSNNDSILLCGVAGIGKSETIARISEVMFPSRCIKLNDPYLKIIPILVIEVSTIASFKSFLINVLYSIDRMIGTNYGNANNKTNVTTDELLIATSKGLNAHVLLMVIEEMNFINDGNRAYSFSNQIVALINIINVSVIFIGTPKALSFFSSSDYLARRALGKIYRELVFEEFEQLAMKLFEYNYTLKKPSINGELIRFLYKATGGIPSLLKQVVSEAMVYAISTGYERLDMKSIQKAVENKLATMGPYLKSDFVNRHQKHVEEKVILNTIVDANGECIDLFAKAAKIANKDTKNVINYIKQYINVEEVNI